MPVLAVAASLILLSGCEEDSGGGVGNIEFTGIYVTLSETNTTSGAIEFAQAMGTTAGGDEYNLTEEVTWSTNPPELASVAQDGEIRTYLPGEVEITADFEDLSDSNGLTVDTVQFTTGQAAAVVIGQPNFTTNVGGTTASQYSNNVQGGVAAYQGRLYVSDSNNNRIMGYNQVPEDNGEAADFVIGQSNFTSNATNTTATGLSHPEQLLVAGGNFYVVDQANCRILIWDEPPTDESTPADVVVGQADFTTANCIASQTTLYYPTAVALVGNKLIVADGNNNRVLIWNTIPTTNGEPADVVLGQTNFTNNGVNAGGSCNAATLSFPSGAWSDGTRLFVTDYGNHRILGWNSVPTTDFESADFVIGQASFGACSFATASNRFRNPYGNAASDGVQFAVADGSNHRVLIWNTVPSGDVSANVVLGQINFTSNGNATTSTAMFLPRGVLFYGRSLLVSEGNNYRVTIFHGN